MENIIHLAERWALEIAADCMAAQHSITVSALSLHPPRTENNSPWGRLWQSWSDAAERGVRVRFFLPAPSKIHPATAYNDSAGECAFAAGMHTRFVPQPNLLHAKSVIIDGQIVWIGSGNNTAA